MSLRAALTHTWTVDSAAPATARSPQARRGSPTHRLARARSDAAARAPLRGDHPLRLITSATLGSAHPTRLQKLAVALTVVAPPVNLPAACCASAVHVSAWPHATVVEKLAVTLFRRPTAWRTVPLTSAPPGAVPVQSTVPLMVALPPRSTVPGVLTLSVACGAAAR